MEIKKRPVSFSKYLLFFLLGTAILIGLGSLWKHEAIHEHTRKKPTVRYSAPDMQMKGMTLRYGLRGQLVSTLGIGEMKVVKKKIGLFRIGGMRQLELEGLVLNIFLPEKYQKNHLDENHEAPVSLKEYLSGMVPSFKTSLGKMAGGVALSGFEGRDIRIEVHRGPQTVLRCNADGLQMTRRKRIELHGNTIVTHNGKTSKNKKIFIDPQSMTMTVGQNEKILLNSL